MKRFVVVLWLVLLEVLAQTAYPPSCSQFALPSTDSQFPNSQQVLICKPQAWNGQLVVYAHGYKTPFEPLSLPLDDLSSFGGFLPEILLKQGFAFAATSYHKSGFFISQAMSDINALEAFFKTWIAPQKIQRVYLVGNSEGGLVITLLLERFPQLYSGGLALCAPLGGLEAQIQYVSDFRVAFDYFFPDVFPFGAAEVPADAYKAWDAYTKAIRAAILEHPAQANQLFRITRAAKNPGNVTGSMVQTALDTLWYNIFGTNDFVQTVGGFPYDNHPIQYQGSRDNIALNATVERFSADPKALEAIRNLQPSGDLHRPLITLHNLFDPVVPFRQELLYLEQVNRNSHEKLLSLWPIARYGHCSFTADELLEAFQLLILEGLGQGPPDL